MNKTEQAKYIIRWKGCHDSVKCLNCVFRDVGEEICRSPFDGDEEKNKMKKIITYYNKLRRNKINTIIDE